MMVTVVSLWSIRMYVTQGTNDAINSKIIFRNNRFIQSPTGVRFPHYTVAQFKSNKQKLSIRGTLRSIINLLKKASVGYSHKDKFGNILKLGKYVSDNYHFVLNDCLLALHICISVMKAYNVQSPVCGNHMWQAWECKQQCHSIEKKETGKGNTYIKIKVNIRHRLPELAIIKIMQNKYGSNQTKCGLPAWVTEYERS